jgi:hypothetical protein
MRKLILLHGVRVALVGAMITTAPLRYGCEHAGADACILAGWCALFAFYCVRLGTEVAKKPTTLG